LIPLPAAGFPLYPEQASTIAKDVDLLFLFEMAVALFFTVAIFTTIFYFAIRYRRRRPDETTQPLHESHVLEIAWSVFPLIIAMSMFGWAGWLYFKNSRPPVGSTELYVVGKQWMWKIQHPEGQREINEMHVPVGRPIKLIMTSEDVIHSYYMPAFRIKQDVIPGRYTTQWFQATKPGKYHLFCAEYCGTLHSGMIGTVYVMEPADYEAWLSGGATVGTMSATGEKIFQRLGCATCHVAQGGGRGPSLVDTFGKQVQLQDGAKVVADEAYIRESILNPNARIVAGYQPVMPTFQGQVNEETLLQLIAYIKSLAKAETPPAGVTPEPKSKSPAKGPQAP
jgi:cytochrome c oxidase subunit 2